MLKGGWWWKSCGRGLNGLYLNDPQDLTARQGMDNSLSCIICLTEVLWMEKNKSELPCICSRYCVVPLERMGLHSEESCYDDQAKRHYQYNCMKNLLTLTKLKIKNQSPP